MGSGPKFTFSGKNDMSSHVNASDKADSPSAWPALPYSDWSDTCETLLNLIRPQEAKPVEGIDATLLKDAEALYRSICRGALRGALREGE